MTTTTIAVVTDDAEGIDADELNKWAEFDSPFEVLHDGRVRHRHDLHAPSLYDGALDSLAWSLPMTGYSGQDRYDGPIMHNSEQFAGRLAEDVLDDPGVYVLVVADWSPDDDEGEDADYVEGWAVAKWDGETLSQIWAEYGPDDEDCPEPRRFVLVETNVRGSTPPYWVTTHDTTEKAARYSFEQEYASDWANLLLLDTTTGQRVTSDIEVTFSTTVKFT